MKLIKEIKLFCCVFSALLFSCSDSLNFDQADTLVAEPEIEASILYIEAPERIINEAAGTDFFVQDFNFDAFSSDFFAERVVEGTVAYVIENTTSKQLEVTVEFLDESGNTLDSEVFMIDPAPAAPLEREILYGGIGRNLDIVTNTSSIRVSAENVLGDTTSTSNLPDPKVILKSKGKFKLSVI